VGGNFHYGIDTRLNDINKNEMFVTVFYVMLRLMYEKQQRRLVDDIDDGTTVIVATTLIKISFCSQHFLSSEISLT
jgi:hypothetical protein